MLEETFELFPDNLIASSPTAFLPEMMLSSSVNYGKGEDWSNPIGLINNNGKQVKEWRDFKYQHQQAAQDELIYGGVRYKAKESLNSSIDASENEYQEYWQIVSSYIDTLLLKGRDIYGSEESPLLAVALDENSQKIYEEMPDNLDGLRPQDRIWSGANPMHDQNIYQVLYSMTTITGDSSYGENADKIIDWFFENTQSPKTGLMAWGEHSGWDFHLEDLPDKNGQEDIHEFFRPWVLWNRTNTLAPLASYKFALGLWKHQMADTQDGHFSRHARYSYHDPEANRYPAEFPRHGGFYIDTWATSYKYTQGRVFLKAIATLVNYFEQQRDSISGSIPAKSTKPEWLWPTSNLSLAIDLSQSAAKLPEKLASKLTNLAESIDETYLTIAHDPGDQGFVLNADNTTLKPADRTPTYSDLWMTGYGDMTTAQVAMIVLSRYNQVGLDGYKELFLTSADRYLDSTPDLSNGILPITIASVIAVQKFAYGLTGEQKYLDRAHYFADLGINIFFKDNNNLPRMSSQNSHYEAITGGDTLAMVLLDLWALENRPDLELDLIWSDR